MVKKKFLQFKLDASTYYKVKQLMDEEGVGKDEFIPLLTNHIEDTRKILRKGKVSDIEVEDLIEEDE